MTRRERRERLSGVGIHHRGTEATEEEGFSLAGSPAFQRDRPLAREKKPPASPENI
jgi:hypothetical protein